MFSLSQLTKRAPAEELKEPKAPSDISPQQFVVLELMGDGLARTDRDLTRELGFSDMNSVRPRVTELVQNGYLKVVAKVRDAETGKSVRLVTLVEGS